MASTTPSTSSSSSSRAVFVRPVHEDIALLLLRVTLALNLLLHGIAKIVHPESLGWIGDQLSSRGLPAFLSYGVFMGELVAPALILVGLFTRPAAALVVVNMIFALFLAHSGELFSLNETGGWAIELQSFYLMVAVVLMITGAGRFGVVKGNGRLH